MNDTVGPRLSPSRILIGLTPILVMLFSSLAVAQPETSGKVSASERYQAGWLHRNLYGSQYRQLWAQEIEVPLSEEVIW